jgi:hypothetical protein
MSRRRVAKLWLAGAVVLMVGSVIGFAATLMLGAFVFDKYDAYGEVPVPGTGKLHLPAGQVTVNFHTMIIGRSSGVGLPIPRLMLDIDPPPGVPNPKVTESLGGSTSVNNDIHRRVWVVDIATEGDYVVTAAGQVNGFIDPRLAFGHGGGGLQKTWLAVCAGLFVIGLVGTTLSVRIKRQGRAAPPVAPARVETRPGQGVKIEQLKTLAALRDSGALTESEFQAEKRRVLDGG